HHALAADVAIVRDVCERHEEVVASDGGHTTARDRAAIHGREFAEHVAVTDLEPRRFAFVLEVLRRVADGRKLVDLVARADRRGTVDDGVRADPGTGADLYAGADHGIRAHGHVGGELRLRRHDGARV